MRRCELCKAKARMYCASDRARLCWNCDAAVHSANFLVARHSRSLLCDVCQSPTPWTASGGKLAPTVAVCEQCAGQERFENSGGEGSEAEEEQEAEEEENQVVPWSTPPPPAESSSSGDESVDGEDVVVSRKLLRIEADRSCEASRLIIRAPPPYAAAEASSRSKPPPPQTVRAADSGRVNVFGSEILDSLRRLHQEETSSGQEMAEFCCDYLGPSI